MSPLAPAPKLMLESTEPAEVSRTTREWLRPLTAVKPPPSTSLLSACTLTVLTKLFAETRNVALVRPVNATRATLVPVVETNCPPTTRLVTPPRTWTPTSETEPTGPLSSQLAAKVASTVPLVSTRARPGVLTPLTCVKLPPRIKLPSPGRTMVETGPLAEVVKVASSVPFVPRRATKLWVTLLTVVKEPPITILPSGCKATASTGLFGPVPAEKLASKRPLVVSRARRLTAWPLTLVKKPPMTTLPSGCSARVFTKLSVAATKLVSGVPSTFNRAT